MNKITQWEAPSNLPLSKITKVASSFLDVASTSFGKATHYKTKVEIQQAEIRVHDKMIGLDRDLYAVFLLLPGVTDRSLQLGIRNLLSMKRKKDGIIDAKTESRIIYKLLQKLPPQRMLKIIESFNVTNIEEGIMKANNARTRKLILRTILRSKKLDFWSIKYRQKLRRALTHAWGNRKASIIKSILEKPAYSRTTKEWNILVDSINKFLFKLDRVGVRRQIIATKDVYECVGFILGNSNNLELPLLQAYEDAKLNIEAGAILPPEVLEGIRGTYHPSTPKEAVLKLTAQARSMTIGQKMSMQRQAKNAGVRLDFNPSDYSSNKLYIYAFEQGMTKQIEEALLDKAYKNAQDFPIEYNTVGVVVDASSSMMGNKEQKLKPIADALALRDMLQRTGKKYILTYAGGGLIHPKDDRIVFPRGATSLSEAFLQVFLAPEEETPDAVFVISDGFENRPSGRFSEVVDQMKKIGMNVPVYHLNPVSSGEDVRSLSPDVPTLPIQNPEGLGLSILRGLLEKDPIKAINSLLGLVQRKMLR